MTQAKTQHSIIMLAGRKFVSVSVSTLEHDYWFALRLRRAGLEVVELGTDEDREAFSRRLLDRLLEDGAAFELLSGLIVPMNDDGEPARWSPRAAEGVATFLKGLREEDDKAAVTGLVCTMLADFFERGLSSIVTSPGSAAGAQPDVARNGSSGGRAASSISAPSASTYARSLSTTPSSPSRSSAAGRSARHSWRSRIAATVRRWLHGSTKT